MAMGRRRKRVRQDELWTPTAGMPVNASHPFYQRLNQILDEKKFDEYVETICEDFYAGEVGRPGLSPGIYFRLLMVGYFEGIDSERGIAWRASDSLSIRSFRARPAYSERLARSAQSLPRCVRSELIARDPPSGARGADWFGETGISCGLTATLASALLIAS